MTCSDFDTNTFLKEEDGTATPLVIIFVLIFMIIGGLAVDYSKAVNERTQMQLATETAAHSGLYSWTRAGVDIDGSRDIAMAMTTGMLPAVAFRDAILDDDVLFGFWDPATETFTEDETFVEDKNDPRRSAVRVYAELEPSRGNESNSILLNMIGWDTFTIRAYTIYASYYPPCFNEGFVAEGVVDMQSNTSYTDGFCVHSNTYVSLNQNNYFEPGTVVSMPNLADLDIPNSGFEQNEGLETALRQGKYGLNILNDMDAMFNSLRLGMPTHASVAGVTQLDEVMWPADLSTNGNGNNGNNGNNNGGTDTGGTDTGGTDTGGTDTGGTDTGGTDTGGTDPSTDDTPAPVLRYTENDTGKKTLTPDAFDTANRIYRLDCSGNGDITLSAGEFRDFALVTNCSINTSNGTVLNNVLLATDGDVSASHLQIGIDDNCAPGGGAAIWTKGSFNAASNLRGFGAQMLALGDISFAAQADGIEGVSFIAGGEIDGTSENDLGFCNGGGMEDFTNAPYFRMVE